MKEKDCHYMRMYNKVTHKDNLVGQKKTKRHRLGFSHTHRHTQTHAHTHTRIDSPTHTLLFPTVL